MFDAQSAGVDRSPVEPGVRPVPVAADGQVPATVADIARWEAECGHADRSDPVEPAEPVEPVEHIGEQVGALVDEVAPGVELARVLADADLGTVDDHTLVEIVAAWHRLGSWVAANTARAAAVLSERESMNPDWPAQAGHVTCTDTTGEELAMRLGCSRRQARLLVRDGRAFEGHLAPTGHALAGGHIDPAKARLLVEALVDLPVELALHVQDTVLPGADRRTPTQLNTATQREIITADPTGAHDRHQTARGGRRVNAPRPLPHGMAGLWAVLPAAGAIQLDTTLDALARTARTTGDPRTLDQLRADLLIDLGTGTLPMTTNPPATPDTSNNTHPTDNATADDNATQTTHTGTHDPDDPGDPGGPGDPEAGSPPRRLPQRARINVTVALTTLAGIDNHPADLTGYGPITAQTARILAREGTWQRILTDPITGTVLDVGRTRYQPPTDLAEHVRTRDHTCTRPGCSTPATSCDLDHTHEYHQLGTTSHTNLGPLCRRDHTIKTHAGYHLTQPTPGTFTWTTPTGHHYTLTPGHHTPYHHHQHDPKKQPGNTDPPPY